MVVGLAITSRRRVREIGRRLPRAGVVLAGLAVLHPQSGGVSWLSPEVQLRAIAGLAGGPQGPTIAAPTHDDVGSSASSLPLDFTGNSLGPLVTQRSSAAVTTLLDSTLSGGADNSGLDANDSPVSAGRRAAWGGSQAVCGSDQLAMRLQAGGGFWTSQAVSGAPVGLPLGVFTASAPANANPLALGPGGDRSNLSPPGPAGAWCRPLPVPFARSSPLASRIFWTPVAIVLVAVAVFWSSRGVKMPS